MPGDFKLRRNHRRLAGAELRLLFNETDDDVTRAFHAVGTPAYFDRLKAVFQLARELDMAVDLTLAARTGAIQTRRIFYRQL